MDLGTIKKRIESNYYTEAESVISDIQLVWRNAMKYNRKGTVIYNYAQALDKEFNNMVKLAKKGLLLPGSQQDWCATCKLGGTLLCCDGGCGRGFHLHCVGYQEMPTDETWYCEDCLQRKDELDIDGLDNSNTTTSTSTSVTTKPITTISNESYAKVKYNIIIDEIESLADTQGRIIAELFFELPSKELYADYYEYIKNPISLAEIREKIDSYTSIEEFVNDFNLMVKNAQTYNLPKSQVFRDSQKLDKYFTKLLSQHFPQYAESIKKQTPIKKAASTPITNNTISSTNNVSYMEEDIDIGRDEPFTGLGTLITPNSTTPYKNNNVSTPNSASKREAAKGNKFNYYKEEVEEADNENEYGEETEEEDNDDEDEDGKRKRGSQPVKSEIPLVFEDKKVVEKILGDRIIEGSDPNTPEYEYFIKWKGKSYLHVSWIEGSVLNQTTVGRNRIKRYWQKKQENESQLLLNEDMEGNTFFNPELCEVDKIIAKKELIVSGETKSMYLVKWKNQNYTEATWERPEDIGDDQKINEFLKFNTKPFLPYRSPTALEVRSVKRWQQMVQSPPFRAGNKLRPYQLEGLNWLVFCWYEGRGSILADEMGLGKTIQAISFINYLHTRENIHGPFLIVSPLSTIGHWLREIEEWTDLDVVLYQGNKANRELCRNYEFYYSDNTGKPIDKQELKFNVLLTTYEMLLGDDFTELQNIKWRVLVTDEAQRLKNQSSKLLVRMKTFKSEHRILLTGTPIQNNTQELWSLLNFIEPNKFASINAFSQEFGQLKDAEQVSRLHTILRPHLLRRMKEDVEKSIPPKEETLVEVELTSLQKLYYRAILERNRDFLNRGCTAKNVPNLINVVMQLRKVCNHPFLIKGVEEKETQFSSTEEYYEAVINGSGKLVLLDKLLPKLKEGGHKVLIFSQMIKVLDLLESYLKYRGHLYERLDGGVRGNDRQASIDRFCKPGSDRFAFLLCTRAGGVGINLTSADTVIIYDSDWNPQNDIQAQARCHRIGQTQEVKVYRLISAKTYERHMFERSSKKLGLDQAVLHDMGAPTSMTTNANPNANPKSLLDKKNIDSLLKYGAYDLFKGGEDDKESEKRFKEEDIDQILNRSSKVVWKEGTDGTQENQPSSSFSKATFTASSADSEIDVNDPNFWDLVLPEAKTAEKLLQKLEKGELSTREKRNSFLKDLSELVRDVVNGFKQGKFEEVARTRNILMQLFDAIKIDMSEFTEDQQTKLLTWGEEISRPARRERKNTSRFGSSNEVFFDEKGKKEKWTSKFKSKTKIRKGVPGAWKKWSEKERKLFHRAFMGFGLDRWEDIKLKSGLNNAFEEEIREYAEEFIKQCIVHSEESDRDLYIKCLTAIMSPDQTLQLELRVDPEFKINKRRVKHWSKNLIILQKIKEALPDILDVDSLKDLVELPTIKKPITTWWSPEEDKSLLIGVFKHGVGEYDAIKTDPELSFSNYSQEFGKKSSSASHSNEDSDDQAETEEQSGQQQETRLTSSWPSNKILETHLMLLLETLIKNNNTSQRQTARQQRVTNKQQSKRKIKEEREREWSKREQNEFRLALIMYGPFNWERVRTSAGLRKTDDQMQEYYEYLLDECRKIIEEAIKRPQRRGATDKEEEEIEEEDEDNEPAEKKQKLDSDYRGETDKGIVSISMAKKILTRVTLFDDIKRSLKHSQIKERLSSSIDIRSAPSSWWCSPQHDEYLLHCVDKYGIGSEEWQILLENKQSPFYINDEGNLEFKKQKETFLKEYTKDKTEFIRRLEYLCMVVLDPDSAKGSRRDRKRMWEGRAIVTRGSRGEGGEELMEQSLDLASPSRMKLNLNFKLSTKDVARDEDGKPIVPFTAKGATILNLGKVVYDRPSFHSKNYIWPVGYKSSRKLPSIDKSSDYVSYISEIVDGGSAPIFKVTPSDKPHLAQTHNTSSGVWCEILKMIKKKQTVSVSGPEMFGFSDPLVKMLIQELPDARKCTSYQWKDFDSPYSNASEASTPIKSEPKVILKKSIFVTFLTHKRNRRQAKGNNEHHHLALNLLLLPQN